MDSVPHKAEPLKDWAFIGAQISQARSQLRTLPRHAPRAGAIWPLTKPDDIITTTFEAWVLGIYEGPMV